MRAITLPVTGAPHAELYKPADYTASQTFGEAIRASGGDGIVYDSVRHVGGRQCRSLTVRLFAISSIYVEHRDIRNSKTVGLI